MAQYLVSQHLSQQYEQSQQQQQQQQPMADHTWWPPHFLPSLEASVPSLPAFHNVLAALAASQAAAQAAPPHPGSLPSSRLDVADPRHAFDADLSHLAPPARDALRADQAKLDRDPVHKSLLRLLQAP